MCLKRPKRLTATITTKHRTKSHFIINFTIPSIYRRYFRSLPLKICVYLVSICWNIRPTSPLVLTLEMLIDKIWPQPPRILVSFPNKIKKIQRTLRQYTTQNTHTHRNTIHMLDIFMNSDKFLWCCVWISFSISHTVSVT